MKVLVHFQQSPKYDNFQGARLRKTIKSALEMLSVPYTDTPMGDFDVAHLIYPVDDGVLFELSERNVPIVVSALYCEDDPTASYIEYKNKDGNITFSIKSKFVKFLDRVDLVLVPDESSKEFLKKEGVNTRIEVCPVGTNLARFDFSRDDEKDIFYRYFSCDRDKRIAIAVGDSTSEIDGLSVILRSANVCEDVNFYYFTKSEKGYKLKRNIRRIIKKLPKNVFVSNMVPDDVYRSALLNADVFIHPGYRPAGIISIDEAMAAKCQIIMRKKELLADSIVDQENAYVASFSETLAGITKDYFEGKIKPTIDKAYKMVSKRNIKVFGDRLLSYYQELLNK